VNSVAGIDPSGEGIRIANLVAPNLRLEQGDAYEPQHQRLGTFPVVVSLEVFCCIVWPRKFLATCHDLLEPGGKLILSTQFHGYWKNLAIALAPGLVPQN
jgi:2-polyprenyl-3-methyl-5-hydroxy-6-metoxy-1,4-benzoquinol methylase